MSVRSSEVAKFLQLDLCGRDVEISRVSDFDSASKGCVTWIKRFSTGSLEFANQLESVLVIAPPEYSEKLTSTHLISNNPKLDFSRVISEYFLEKRVPCIESTAVIHPSAKIGGNVSIGHFSVIEEDVVIGHGTSIGSHCVIRRRTQIGKHCVFKSHAVIGEQGFGFAFQDDGVPIRMEHLGAVVIGDDVEVGAFVSIARGTLGNTVINSGAKIDDLVLVAHNSVVGYNTIIAGGATIAGSVEIGSNSWIGAHAVVMNGKKIGEGALVGLGCTATRNIKDFEVVLGHGVRHFEFRSAKSRFA